MRRRLLITGVLWLSTAVPVLGQVESITVAADQADLGLGGWFRPGTWTPLVLRVENKSAQPRRVIGEWSLADVDGDTQQSRRLITLSPQSVQRIWLYACPPHILPARAEVRARLIEVGADDGLDTDSGREVARLAPALSMQQRVAVNEKVIAVLGAAPNLVGLLPYQRRVTQVESCRLVAGMQGTDLPDRWHGLSLAEALVWTPDPAVRDPSAASISDASRQAVREWVRRGGHLVVILPEQGDWWSDSALGDLLPARGGQIQRVEGVTVLGLPPWLGMPRADAPGTLAYRWFDVQPDRKVAVVLRDRELRPVVIAGQYGLGRVTMIGVDLTHPRLTQLRLPNPITTHYNPVGVTLWPTVFGWRGPVYAEAVVNQETGPGGKFVRSTQGHNIAGFIAPMVSMSETAAPAVLLAVLTFVLYWVLAGPVSFAVLKARGQARHAWVAYAGIVALFSVAAWGGALFLRPTHARVAHFTVLTGDLGGGEVRGQSWLTVYVPNHGRSDVALKGGHRPGGGDTIARPGAEETSDAGGFIDVQTYSMDAASPGGARLPMRATAKSFEVDFMGPAPAQWGLPEGRVRLVGGWPEGVLTHHLPGPLREVRAVYSTGAAYEAALWSWGRWEPGVPLTLRRGAARGQVWFDLPGGPGQEPGTPLVIAPVAGDSVHDGERQWRGYLGDALSSVVGRPSLGQFQAAGAEHRRMRAQDVDLLTFFGTLPPHDFRYAGMGMVPSPERPLGRSLDLSHLLALRRIIIVGYIESETAGATPPPLPLTVDGRALPASGTTVVRWVVPVEE